MQWFSISLYLVKKKLIQAPLVNMFKTKHVAGVQIVKFYNYDNTEQFIQFKFNKQKT